MNQLRAISIERYFVSLATIRWDAFDAEFCAEAKQKQAARRLMSISKIGALYATYWMAAIGEAHDRIRFSGGEDEAPK